MKTPRYVKEAVRVFVEEGRREFLIQQFENGIPLFEYPESRDLIIKALLRVSPRSRGQKQKDVEKERKEVSAIMLWATLEGAGFPRYGDSPDTRVVYGYEIVGKNFGFSLRQLKSYWKKHSNAPSESAQIERQLEFGKSNRASLRAFYLEYLKSGI